jgi:formate-dependent nitrite reductase cytochrome c552 subunit
MRPTSWPTARSGCSTERSTGFHAPAATLRVLGEAIDYARQGIKKVAEARGKR